MKVTIGYVVYVSIMGVVIWLILSVAIKSINKETSSYSINVGKKVVLNNDTLLITNYSTFDKTYTLSNGVKVDTSLISKLKQVK